MTTDEKLVSELEVIHSEYQLLDIRLGNVIETLRQQQSDERQGNFTEQDIRNGAEKLLKPKDDYSPFKKENDNGQD